ncbi:hypothetical protein BDY24DRAFT_79145 [Mrakia frigida]|uniref:uncharacterized protein n=1 Tax=Mrakia frigida TaxID=29902 RepID=UPI003FCC19FA
MPNPADEPLPTYSVPLPSGHSTADPLFSVHEVESPFLPSPSTPSSSSSSPSTPSYLTQDVSPLPSVAEIDGQDLPDGWIKQWDYQNDCEFYVDTKSNPPRSIWVHPFEDPDFIQSIPDSQQSISTSAPSSTSTAASRAAAESIRVRREEQDRRTHFMIADSARRNYDFANGYNAEDSMRFNRPPVRYPTSSSSFSGRPTSPQLTAAEVRQRREAQDSRSRYVDLSWTQLEGGS